ncbi:Protein of unknown function [Gryllus bimaculatus]|nr:Protein of unknown function [Gryllus bimaculatus]
MLWTAPQA